MALVHGDGQYAPECLPDLVGPLRDGEADAVFGSRMLEKGGALRGGMPLYKFVGNRILSGFQNRMLGASLSEFHSGYRVYSVAALRKVPFPLNTNDFHFDTEIIIQFMLGGMRIKELPIPTYYGDEICRVNGVKYAWDVTKAVMVARSRSWACSTTPLRLRARCHENAQYEPKLDYAARTPRRWNWFRRERACSIWAVRAVTLARCCAAGKGAASPAWTSFRSDRVWSWTRSCCTISTTDFRR